MEIPLVGLGVTRYQGQKASPPLMGWTDLVFLHLPSDPQTFFHIVQQLFGDPAGGVTIKQQLGKTVGIRATDAKLCGFPDTDIVLLL